MYIYEHVQYPAVCTPSACQVLRQLLSDIYNPVRLAPERNTCVIVEVKDVEPTALVRPPEHSIVHIASDTVERQ